MAESPDEEATGTHQDRKAEYLIAGLTRQFSSEMSQAAVREAAETAYALAIAYRSNDVDGARRWDQASKWANECVRLLDAIPSDRLNDVVSTRDYVIGVPLPELLHSNVARARLFDVL